MKDSCIGRLQRTRRRLREELTTRLLVGEDPVEVAPALLRFVRLRRNIRNAIQRVKAVRATSLNLPVFSSEQALSLIRFQPNDVKKIARLHPIDQETYPGRNRASTIESI